MELNAAIPSPAQMRDQTRFLVGDTDSTNQLVQDEEILFAVSLRSSIYGAAAVCCRNLAARFSILADSSQGPLHTSLSQKARNYRMMAGQYENEALSRGALPGYAGGISVTDKVMNEEDPDRVAPSFNVGMDDNFYPIAPAGNELEDQGPGQTDA